MVKDFAVGAFIFLFLTITCIFISSISSFSMLSSSMLSSSMLFFSILSSSMLSSSSSTLSSSIVLSSEDKFFSNSFDGVFKAPSLLFVILFLLFNCWNLLLQALQKV